MYRKFPYKTLLTLIFLIAVIFQNAVAFAANGDEDGKGTIEGRVITEKNKPAENVSVLLKGTTHGAITNEDGKFRFKAPAGDYILVVTHVGAQAQEISVTVKASQTTVVPAITISISTNALNEVTVNAGKTNKFATKTSDYVAKMPLANIENPQVYTSVSKELLQEQGLFSADAAIQNVPGITQLWAPTGRVGDGGSYLTLRGFPVQTALRNGLSGNVTSTIDAANLESLEVIKGPEGTLYGSSLVSFGGLINRVTKKPFDTEGGEITYSAGSYNLNRVSIDYNTPLDTAKRALFRINSAYTNSSTFQDNGSNKNFVFDPSFSYKVDDRLTLSFDAEISHGTSPTPSIYYFGTTVAALGVTNANQLSVNYKEAYQGNDLITTSDNANFFARADYKISDNWKSETNISATNSSSGGYQPFFYLLAGNNSIARDVWEVSGRSNTLQIQQNFVGDFKIGNLRNRLVAGIDYLNQSQDIKYSNPSNGSDAFDVVNTRGDIPAYNNFNKAKVDSLFQKTTLSDSYARSNTNTYSAYASDVLNVTNNLLATASLRVDYFRTSPVYDPTSGTSTQSFNQATVSPKFGLVYKLFNDQVSLFGNYMNGFINPGYGEVYNDATQGLTQKLFKTEEANQLEGGIKANAFNGKLSGTVSYYDIKVTNEVIADPLHANASIQDGTQNSKGIEVQLAANPLNGFNIIAGFSHNTSLMTKASSYNNDRRPETAGPPNSANLWLSYTITEGNIKGLGIGFGGNYASNNEVINDSYNGVFTLPSYTIFNSGVFYNKERFRLSLNVNNLTNKEYYTGYTTVDPQMLRQVIGSVAFKF